MTTTIRWSGPDEVPKAVTEALSRLRVDESGRFSSRRGDEDPVEALRELSDLEKQKFNDNYDISKSTDEFYRANESAGFTKCFETARAQLDYNYHSNYQLERQYRVQDPIIAGLINRGRAARRPWLVFTAGVMGAGKSHTLTTLYQYGLFNLECFVRIDPDEVRRMLPEFEELVEKDPENAGKKTQKEAGLICEVATLAAMEQSKNILQDGSLRNAGWYKDYFEFLRRRHPQYQLGILHVTASAETIKQRAKRRGEKTGRMIPEEVFLEAMDQVPGSVEALSPYADYVATIENDGGELYLRQGASNFLSFKGKWGLCESLGGMPPEAKKDVITDLCRQENESPRRISPRRAHYCELD